MKIKIRKAENIDLKAIHDLVMELAIYEKAPEEFTASIEDYVRDFETNWFEAIVAELNNEVVGMMLFYHTYSTWKGRMLYLEDFVVKEAHRRNGVGALLMEELIKIAQQKKCKLIKWQVLDWNMPAIEFYKKYECKFEAEWLNVKYFIN